MLSKLRLQTEPRLSRVLKCVCCCEIDCFTTKVMRRSRRKDWPSHLLTLALFDRLAGFHRRRGIITGTLATALDTKERQAVGKVVLEYFRERSVTLPSRAVCWIRTHVPIPGIEEDFTFEGLRFADERLFIYYPFRLLSSKKIFVGDVMYRVYTKTLKLYLCWVNFT